MERAKASVEEIRHRVADLANTFLPDGLNPFVDVFVRVRARREMRELIDSATVEWHRHTPGQLIEMIFYGDGRSIRKVIGIYGKKKAAVPIVAG
ncbi:MAG: hypothetical protein QF554_13480 [Dehalococcoidia bacterium]|nr:hypothetical protein [Dehalococcoidia bacterium]